MGNLGADFEVDAIVVQIEIKMIQILETTGITDVSMASCSGVAIRSESTRR